MNHPWHRHPLRLNRDKGDPFECSGCKELGFGPRYQCAMNCHFVLHEDCFKARPTDPSIIHPFMGNCRFQFLWEPLGGPNRLLCDACGRDVRGFVYHDQSRHKLDLHRCCMNLKSTMSDPYGRMVLTLTDKMSSRCVKCERKDLQVPTKGPFRGWSYMSSCGNYCYHVYCVKTLILDNWERGYFSFASSSYSSSSCEQSLKSMFASATSSSALRTSIRSDGEQSLHSKLALATSSSALRTSKRSDGKQSLHSKLALATSSSALRTSIRSDGEQSLHSKLALATRSSALRTSIRSDGEQSLHSKLALATSSSALRTSVRSDGEQSLHSKLALATSSLALATSMRPRTSSFIRGLMIKMAKIGFRVIISVVFGNPTPILAAFAENLLN